MKTSLRPDILDLALAAIAKNGIKVDARRLKQDMASQFADHREWIREYVTNAFDARAIKCSISGREDGQTLTVVVEDDGCGMDRQRLLDFMTLFKNNRVDDARPVVGTHGIGKLSIAAIPGQCGFRLQTSTGTEAWQLSTGRLLEEQAIRLEEISPAGPRGTRFEIVFAKELGLRREMEALRTVLDTFVRYLPIETVIWVPDSDEADARETPCHIRQPWLSASEAFTRTYTFSLLGKSYEVVLGAGAFPSHELYQQHVFVTSDFNLLSFDLPKPIVIPHIRIRVESPDFEMPFGRHRLRNEELALKPLSRLLRDDLVPQFVAELIDSHAAGLLPDRGVNLQWLDEICCALMAHDSRDTRAWCGVPVFAVLNGPRLSLRQLRALVRATGQCFLQQENASGIDYAAFPAPVLASKQPKDGLELLIREFRHDLITLGLSDTIFEAPATPQTALGTREKRFERYLRFSPDAVRKSLGARPPARERPDGPAADARPSFTTEELQQSMGLTDEIRQSFRDLASLRWRVGYLVGNNGVTPCRTHYFIIKQGTTIVLNLHHPEVGQLVALSERDPALAGHLALALCLTASHGKILPQLTPDTREDVILADAIAKCNTTPVAEDPAAEQASGKSEADSSQDFLRDSADESFGLG